MGCQFIMCIVHASITLQYHRNSGNVVRPKSPTAVSPKTQVSLYAALYHRWRLCHRNTPTDSVTTSMTWIRSDMADHTTNFSTFQRRLTCPMPLAQLYTLAESNCLVAHSRKPIKFNMQTVHWKPWYKQSAVTVGPTRQTHLLGYYHKMTLHSTV